MYIVSGLSIVTTVLPFLVNTFLFTLSPSPNSPFVFVPVCQTNPSSSTTPLWVPKPADIASIFFAPRVVISVFVPVFAVLPSPNCPICVISEVHILFHYYLLQSLFHFLLIFDICHIIFLFQVLLFLPHLFHIRHKYLFPKYKAVRSGFIAKL